MPKAGRILCLEGDPQTSGRLQKRLEQGGYRVDMAASAKEGLVRYRRTTYDLLAVAQSLPDGDGLEVIGGLAAQDRTPPMILIADTGHQEIALAALRLGARDYLIKDPQGKYLDLLPLVIDRVMEYKQLRERLSEPARLDRILTEASRLEVAATLAKGMAHEVNNLMTVVLGSSELLREDIKQRADDLELLNDISRCAAQAARLAQQMLAFARGGNYQSRPLNLNRIVERALLDLGNSIPNRIHVRTELAGNLRTVEADPSLMNQVVMNLLTNAVEAMGRTGTTLRIGTENHLVDGTPEDRDSELSPGRYIRFTVEDDGCGMGRNTLSRVFEPFFTTKFQGRGLGLSVVYGVVRDLRGQIRLHSEPDKGTRAVICLPAAGEGENPRNTYDKEITNP